MGSGGDARYSRLLVRESDLSVTLLEVTEKKVKFLRRLEKFTS